MPQNACASTAVCGCRSLQASLEPLDIPSGQETPPITPTFDAPLSMGSILQTEEYASFHQPAKEAAEEARTAPQRATMRKSVSFRHKDQPSASAECDQQPPQDLQAQQAQPHPSRAATPHPSKLQQRPSRTSLAQPPAPSLGQPDDDQVSLPLLPGRP